MMCQVCTRFCNKVSSQVVLESVKDLAVKGIEAALNKVVADLKKKCERIQDIFMHPQYRDFEEATKDVDALEKSGFDLLLEICRSKMSGELLDAMGAIDSCEYALGTAFEGMLKEAGAINLAGKDDFQKVLKDCESTVKHAREQYESVCANGGKLLGNVCIVQALKRDLMPGETRQGLARRCDKGFAKKKYLQCDPHMHLLLRRHLSDAAAGFQARAAPPQRKCEVKETPPSAAASSSAGAEASPSKQPLAEVAAASPNDKSAVEDDPTAGAVKHMSTEAHEVAAVKDKVKRRAAAPKK